MERWLDLLRAVYVGRRFVCAADVLVQAASDAARLQSFGCEAMAIGGYRGAGELPDGVEALDVGIPPAATMMEGLRAALGALEALPEPIQACVDAFDPERSARVLLPPFGTARTIAGRAVWAARAPEWVALEDKTVVDAFWDRAGVRRVPSQVVPLEKGSLLAAHHALDRGAGTVWAADNTRGWHGGAEFTRHVRTDDDGAEVLDEFQGASQIVRVMPFLEGIPCSVHGMVFPERVLALRPCEMMVLGTAGSTRFRYAQAATFWDPRAEDRHEMHAAALAVGERLRTELGFRGAFTIDGVLAAEGFRPTELNTRYGAALVIMSRSFDGFPLRLLNAAVAEGVDADWDPLALEAELLRRADGQRQAGGMVVVARLLAPSRAFYACVDGRWASTDGPADAEVVIGPTAAGSIVFLRLDPARLQVGLPVAPVVASLLAALDEEHGLGLGVLEAARDVRRA